MWGAQVRLFSELARTKRLAGEGGAPQQGRIKAISYQKTVSGQDFAGTWHVLFTAGQGLKTWAAGGIERLRTRLQSARGES